MAVSSRRVTVTSTATRLDAAPTDDQPGHTILAIAQAAGTLCLGGSDVTTSTGARLGVVANTVLPADLLQTVVGPGSATAQVEGLYAAASPDLAVDVLILGG